ncbi:uncharacterized protein K02A2.6-like [Leguminivora glycinivorella]|uniref:uncharacterized protein K02A2.6-like n=1 Tax=Leguminivora glycinivorella TaxID=1035111 RepID=UPI00200EF4F9|nr:uncharacterized protein K02A2.6-like [Leguminivora glycinivorella]
MTIKRRLSGSKVLAHYDQDKALILTCDASSYGVAGVLTQPSVQGERPIAYASRSLSDAEKNYSQIDKEALAIIYCLKKFNQYLYGRHFTLRTDHKPLVSLFGPKTGVPAMAASRMQRWALILSAFSYDIEYINTKENLADGLSRLPIEGDVGMEPSIPEHTYLHYVQDALAIDSEVIKRETARDPVLSRVLSYIDDGWPDSNDVRNLQPFFNRKKELYSERGCVMWGHRVIVPNSCKQAVLEMLHEPHMGIVKTKSMARSYVWWPGMDEEIEAKCKTCEVCAMEQDSPRGHVPCPWPYPSSSWTRIHVDFMGPINGKLYLVIVDSTSKWLEVFQVSSTSAAHTIEKLTEVFSRFGFPKQLVSDNGPPFTSKEFSEYLKGNHIQHVFSAPYHPSSNGAAENAVRTVKRVVKKAIRQNIDTKMSIQTFLLHYRNTPHCTTGESPAQCLMARKLRTGLDVLKPDRQVKVWRSQIKMAEQAGGSQRSVDVGDSVWIRRYNSKDKWMPGVVSERLGNTDYAVTTNTGEVAHRHVDQLRPKGLKLLSCPLSEPEPPFVNTQSLPSSASPDVSLAGDIVPEVPAQPVVGSALVPLQGGSVSGGSNTNVNSSPVLNRPMPRCTRNKNPVYR